MTVKEYVSKNKNLKLYYSTPFGGGPNGPQLFVLSDKNKNAFFPAFTSIEGCTGFFNSAGRKGFMILEGTLESVIKLISGNTATAEWGVIIDVNAPTMAVIPAKTAV